MFTEAAISHNERFCKGASPNFVKPQVIKVIGIEKQTSLKISLLRKKKFIEIMAYQNQCFTKRPFIEVIHTPKPLTLEKRLRVCVYVLYCSPLEEVGCGL